MTTKKTSEWPNITGLSLPAACHIIIAYAIIKEVIKKIRCKDTCVVSVSCIDAKATKKIRCKEAKP